MSSYMPPTIKLSVFGSTKCGKTTAVKRYIDGDFDESYHATVGGKKGRSKAI